MLRSKRYNKFVSHLKTLTSEEMNGPTSTPLF